MLFGCSFGSQPFALDPHRFAHWRVGLELCAQDCLRKHERACDAATRPHLDKLVCAWLR
jgi:hypothetical protein